MLPVKFDAIGRTATYASWLNFYLCRATVLTDPPQEVVIDEPRCAR